MTRRHSTDRVDSWETRDHRATGKTCLPTAPLAMTADRARALSTEAMRDWLEWNDPNGSYRTYDDTDEPVTREDLLECMLDQLDETPTGCTNCDDSAEQGCEVDGLPFCWDCSQAYSARG